MPTASALVNPQCIDRKRFFLCDEEEASRVVSTAAAAVEDCDLEKGMLGEFENEEGERGDGDEGNDGQEQSDELVCLSASRNPRRLRQDPLRTNQQPKRSSCTGGTTSHIAPGASGASGARQLANSTFAVRECQTCRSWHLTTST